MNIVKNGRHQSLAFKYSLASILAVGLSIIDLARSLFPAGLNRLNFINSFLLYRPVKGFNNSNFLMAKIATT